MSIKEAIEILKPIPMILEEDSRSFLAGKIRRTIELLESELEPTEFTRTIKYRLLNVALEYGSTSEFEQVFKDLKEACYIIDRLTAERENIFIKLNETQLPICGGVRLDRIINELIDKYKQLQAELKNKDIDIECLTAERDSYLERLSAR
jgi:hypothetical protein